MGKTFFEGAFELRVNGYNVVVEGIALASTLRKISQKEMEIRRKDIHQKLLELLSQESSVAGARKRFERSDLLIGEKLFLITKEATITPITPLTLEKIKTINDYRKEAEEY